MLLAFYTAALLPVAALGSRPPIPDDNRMVRLDGILRYPIIPREVARPSDNPQDSNVTKRQIPTDLFSQLVGSVYTIDIGIGTPSQTVPVQFDTATAELWVNPICRRSYNLDLCEGSPRFNPADSSTFTPLGTRGDQSYAFRHEGYARYDYAMDNVVLGGKLTTTMIRRLQAKH